MWVPCLLVMSPTMRCNLRCTGCYSGLYSKKGELSEAEICRILDECRSLGAYFVVISGRRALPPEGHVAADLPAVPRHVLPHLHQRHLARRAHRRRARAPGQRRPGDQRGGLPRADRPTPGPRASTTRCSPPRALADAGILFGVSVTYTRENVDEVTPDEFVQHWIERGDLRLVLHVHAGGEGPACWSSSRLRSSGSRAGSAWSQLRQKYPIFLADFWNDGPAAAGCMAAAHLHAHPQLRPDRAVRLRALRTRQHPGKTILEAANSPFFKRHPAPVSVQRERQPAPALHDRRQPRGCCASWSTSTSSLPATSTPRTSSRTPRWWSGSTATRRACRS